MARASATRTLRLRVSSSLGSGWQFYRRSQRPPVGAAEEEPEDRRPAVQKEHGQEDGPRAVCGGSQRVCAATQDDRPCAVCGVVAITGDTSGYTVDTCLRKPAADAGGDEARRLGVGRRAPRRTRGREAARDGDGGHLVLVRLRVQARELRRAEPGGASLLRRLHARCNRRGLAREE